mgnify:CR=1 FL=1
MKNFLRFIFILIILAVGIYIGINYKEYRRAREENTVAANNINDNIANEIAEKNSNTNTEKTDINSKNDFVITYKDEEKIAKTKKGYIAITNKRNVPTIESKNNPDAAKKIEKELIKISDKMWNEVNENADEYAVDMDNYLDSNSEIGVSYIISTGFKNDKIITFNFETIGSMGGVPWDGYSDIKTGERLTLKSISNNYSKFTKYIADEMEESIDSQGLLDDVKEYISLEEGTTLEDKLIEYEESGNWYFKDDKLMIDMPKYSIGYGAMGTISTDIKVKDINEYLKDEYKF